VKIYKYNLPIQGEIQITMPLESEILTVQVIQEEAFIWVLVNPDSLDTIRTFRIVGIGHEFADAHQCKYLGTFQLRGGEFIFHVFEFNP